MKNIIQEKVTERKKLLREKHALSKREKNEKNIATLIAYTLYKKPSAVLPNSAYLLA